MMRDHMRIDRETRVTRAVQPIVHKRTKHYIYLRTVIKTHNNNNMHRIILCRDRDRNVTRWQRWMERHTHILTINDFNDCGITQFSGQCLCIRVFHSDNN